MPEISSLDSETVCFKVPSKNIQGKSFLVVPEGWEALCLNDGQLGKVLKRGKYKLSTLKGKAHIFEVLFYPTLREFSFLWGTKEQMDFSDPLYSLPIKMGANGKIVFLIKNIRNVYLTSKQGSSILTAEIKAQVVPSLVKVLQEELANYIKENKVSFLDFEKKKDEIFKQIFANLSYHAQNEFGLKLSNFVVDGIIFDPKLFKELEKAAGKQNQIVKEIEKQKTEIVDEQIKQEIFEEEEFEKKKKTVASINLMQLDQEKEREKQNYVEQAEEEMLLL